MKRTIVLCIIVSVLSLSVSAGSRDHDGSIGARANFYYSDLEAEVSVLWLSSKTETETTGYDISLNGFNYFGGGSNGIYYGLELYGEDLTMKVDGEDVESDELESYDITDEVNLILGFSHRTKLSNGNYLTLNAGSFLSYSDDEDDDGDSIEGYIAGVVFGPGVVVPLDEGGNILFSFGADVYVPLVSEMEVEGMDIDFDVSGYMIKGFAGLSIAY